MKKLKQVGTGTVYTWTKHLALRSDMVEFEEGVIEGVVLSESVYVAEPAPEPTPILKAKEPKKRRVALSSANEPDLIEEVSLEPEQL